MRPVEKAGRFEHVVKFRVAVTGFYLEVRREKRMDASNWIVGVAVAAVALVLAMGLYNMMRGGSPERSQKLMRLRVLLQFVAIIIAMGVLWWRAF